MLKNCLAVFGLVCLALLAVLGLLWSAVFMDMAGLGPRWVNIQGTPVLPQDYSSPRGWVKDLLSRTGVLEEPALRVNGVPVTPEASATLEGLLPGSSPVEWSNPLETNPPLFALPTAEPIPTPVPPLEPGVYRAEALLRMKDFAAALESFLATNDRLAEDNALLHDADWRIGMELALEEISTTAQALVVLGPPPAEYTSIDASLEEAGLAGSDLADSYLQALQSNDPHQFETAGEYFERIRAHLATGVEEMTRAGWRFE